MARKPEAVLMEKNPPKLGGSEEIEWTAEQLSKFADQLEGEIDRMMGKLAAGRVADNPRLVARYSSNNNGVLVRFGHGVSKKIDRVWKLGPTVRNKVNDIVVERFKKAGWKRITRAQFSNNIYAYLITLYQE